MNIVPIKLPIKEIAAAIKATKQAKAVLLRIDGETSFWKNDAEVIAKYGNNGLAKRAEILAKAERERLEVIASAQNNILTQAKAARDFIFAQTTPNGFDITGENAGDFALLEHGLIETPEKLQRLLEKHDNTAFRFAAQKYAAVHEWEGFNFFENEAAAVEFSDQIFENLGFAAANPYSAVIMQYAETPSEYSQLADAYGLHDEFFASGGDSLAHVVTAAESGSD